jgi:hypothetical protein
VFLTCGSQVAPTATTCEDFANGTAADLESGTYNVKGLAVNAVAPGVLFYYTHMTVPVGGVLTFTQSNVGSCGSGWPPIPPQSVGQVRVYTSSCGNISSSSTYDATTGTITTTVTGAPAGTEIIVGIKYQPTALKGTPVTRVCHPVETYTFSDSGGSSDTYVLIPKN